jgi:hypothetical protein
MWFSYGELGHEIQNKIVFPCAHTPCIMQCTLVSADSLWPSGCSPFYAPKWDRRCTPWRSTSCSNFTNDICYDVHYNDKDGSGFGVQFQHFFQAFSLDMTNDNMLAPLNWKEAYDTSSFANIENSNEFYPLLSTFITLQNF